MLVKCRWNRLYKYNSSVLQFRNYKVNDLLKNKPKHYVAVFKESLIYDDVSDFFEKSYSLRESILWLHRIINHRGYNNKEAYVSYRDYAVRRIMFKYTYKQIHVKYMKGNNELKKASPHPSVMLVHEIDKYINNNDKTREDHKGKFKILTSKDYVSIFGSGTPQKVNDENNYLILIYSNNIDVDPAAPVILNVVKNLCSAWL